MRYELKNLGPGPFFSVESGKLLQPGDAVNVNRIDDGTKRLATGPNPRLAILDRAAPPATAPSPATAPPRPTRSKAPPAATDSPGTGAESVTSKAPE
jgi:hypothetical protein